MFTDFLGRELIDGEDVIVSLGQNRLHCGVVMETGATKLEIICQYWNGDREYSCMKVFEGEDGKVNRLPSVYKIKCC